MLILGVDTSSSRTSLALLRGEGVVAEFARTHDHPPSDAVFAILEGMLREAAVELREIEVFAACAGPGSFTGLRIGLGMVKTLAFAASRPVYGFDAVRLLARGIGRSLGPAAPDRFTAVVPGWRETTFAAVCERDAQGRIVTDELRWWDDLAGLVAWLPAGNPCFVADDRHPGLPGFRPLPAVESAALTAARAAGEEREAGREPAFNEVQPLYLKPFAVGKKAIRPEDLRK